MEGFRIESLYPPFKTLSEELQHLCLKLNKIFELLKYAKLSVEQHQKALQIIMISVFNPLLFSNGHVRH